MNAVTSTGAAVSGLSTRIGRTVMKVVAAALVAWVVVGAGLNAAEAKPYSAGNMSKGGFIAACEGVDGKVETKDKKGNVIRCTLPNGTYETCNFKTIPVVCNYIPLASGEVDLHGSISGSVNAELTSGGQGASTRERAALLALDETQR